MKLVLYHSLCYAKAVFCRQLRYRISGIIDVHKVSPNAQKTTKHVTKVISASSYAPFVRTSTLSNDDRLASKKKYQSVLSRDRQFKLKGKDKFQHLLERFLQ